MKALSQSQLAARHEEAAHVGSLNGRCSKSVVLIATVPEPTAILRQKIADLVNANALQMVTSVIQKGSGYQSVKYLFELTGIFADDKSEGDPEDESLLKRLLRRLDLPEEAADLTVPLPDDIEDATDSFRNPV